MLAGLPKAPGANNPVANPRRARARQLYVIDRMHETELHHRRAGGRGQEGRSCTCGEAADPNRLHAAYVAETVRQMMYARSGDSIYTSGMKVYTSLVAADQAAAYKSLRKGIMDYERRQVYRGPEKFVDLPASGQKEIDEAVDEALAEHRRQRRRDLGPAGAGGSQRQGSDRGARRGGAEHFEDFRRGPEDPRSHGLGTRRRRRTSRSAAAP